MVVLLAQLAQGAGTRRLSLLAPLGVLPLYAVGVDYARWTELFYSISIIVLAVLMLERRIAPAQLHSRSVQIVLVILIFFQRCLSGPNMRLPCWWVNTETTCETTGAGFTTG